MGKRTPADVVARVARTLVEHNAKHGRQTTHTEAQQRVAAALSRNDNKPNPKG